MGRRDADGVVAASKSEAISAHCNESEKRCIESLTFGLDRVSSASRRKGPRQQPGPKTGGRTVGYTAVAL